MSHDGIDRTRWHRVQKCYMGGELVDDGLDLFFIYPSLHRRVVVTFIIHYDKPIIKIEYRLIENIRILALSHAASSPSPLLEKPTFSKNHEDCHHSLFHVRTCRDDV